MTTTVTTSAAYTDPAKGGATERWPFVGLLAGITGAVSLVASSMAGAVYEDDIAGDAVAITDRLSEMVPQILVFHTATVTSALLMLVFAAGLQRQLAQRLTDSLLPNVAAFGLLLVSVAGLLGSGLTTEFVFGVSDPDLLVPESAVFFGHWIGTIPWVWAGAGVAALAVGLAARRGAYARWVGWTSLGLGGLATLFAVTPVQYMAGAVGPIWVITFSAGLLFSSRERS